MIYLNPGLHTPRPSVFIPDEEPLKYVTRALIVRVIADMLKRLQDRYLVLSVQNGSTGRCYFAGSCPRGRPCA
jgi:hypothetical protein